MSDQKERGTNDIIKEAGNFSCPVQKAAYYMNAFIMELMCGRCFPCALGTHEAATILRDIISGHAVKDDIRALDRIAGVMSVASRCKRGRDTAQFLNEMMMAEAFSEHFQGRCPNRGCASYVGYRVVPERCTMCGECQKACAYKAIVGEKMVPYESGYLPFEIVPKRCTGCGECLKVCPNEAIIVFDKKADLSKIRDPIWLNTS